MSSERWLDELPADERELIEAGAASGAPLGMKQAVWSAVAGKLPLAAAAGTAVVTGGGTALSLVKTFALGLTLGAAVVGSVGGYQLVTSRAEAPLPALTSAPLEPVPVPKSSPPAPTELLPAPAGERPVEPRTEWRAPSRSAESTVLAPPASPPTESPSVASFPPDTPPGVPAPENDVVVESRRVAAAKALLRAGDARGVLRELDALDAAFPRGLLVQEREGLRIEALLALGERTRAEELARRFLTRFPESPHARAVERALR